MQIGAAIVENNMAVSQKRKSRAALWFANSTPEFMSKEDENTNCERYMHPKIHCSIIYNSQDM